MTNFTTIKIKCKPHIGNFLVNNFGKPAIIPDRHILYKMACSQLFKHNAQNIGGKPFVPYTSQIEIGISYNAFKYSGYNINDVNTRIFNEAVDNYIKSICRTNLDSLMISQLKQTEWKEKFASLVHRMKGSSKANTDTASFLRQLNTELKEHEINIKQAIDHVVYNTLKLTYDDISYETIKKDYYRYRNPEQYEKEKKNTKKVCTELSPELNLFSGLDIN